jgi:hypothetical protein
MPASELQVGKREPQDSAASKHASVSRAEPSAEWYRVVRLPPRLYMPSAMLSATEHPPSPVHVERYTPASASPNPTDQEHLSPIRKLLQSSCISAAHKTPRQRG